MTGFRFVSWVCFHANFIAGAAQQLGQQFTYWDCRLHHNGEAVVPWFFREGPAFVTNASGSEKLHRILHRLLASGAYGRLLAALRGINGSD